MSFKKYFIQHTVYSKTVTRGRTFTVCGPKSTFKVLSLRDVGRNKITKQPKYYMIEGGGGYIILSFSPIPHAPRTHPHIYICVYVACKAWNQ